MRPQSQILRFRRISVVSLYLPFTLFESKYYLRPEGATGAYAGRYVTDYAEGIRVDPDDPPAIERSFRKDVRALLEDAVPALRDVRTVDGRVGLRTVTPDGRPIVGETTVPGFYLAAGMSGLGVTLAPAVADLLTAALTGERPAALASLDSDRF